MRDFRDAKAMAHTLRDALKAKAVETTHSECLELIAKAFGYENWNILSAKIEAARSGCRDGARFSRRDHVSEPDQRPSIARSAASRSTRCASLLPGRPSSSATSASSCATTSSRTEKPCICSRIRDCRSIHPDTLVPSQEIARAAYADVERARKHVVRWRLVLEQIKRKLAMRDGEVPAAGNVLALPALPS